MQSSTSAFAVFRMAAVMQLLADRSMGRQALSGTRAYPEVLRSSPGSISIPPIQAVEFPSPPGGFPAHARFYFYPADSGGGVSVSSGWSSGPLPVPFINRRFRRYPCPGPRDGQYADSSLSWLLVECPLREGREGPAVALALEESKWVATPKCSD